MQLHLVRNANANVEIEGKQNGARQQIGPVRTGFVYFNSD